ncbi:MAG: leucine-rich repeat domain-containing protein [Coriobacteriales bacterium]|jgi:hypothetical protein
MGETKISGKRAMSRHMRCLFGVLALALLAAVIAGAPCPAQAAQGTDVVFYEQRSGVWIELAKVEDVSAGMSIARLFRAAGAPAPEGPRKGGYRYDLIGWSTWPGGTCANVSTVNLAYAQRGPTGQSQLKLYPVFSARRVFSKGTCTQGMLDYRMSADGTAACTGPAGRHLSGKVRIPATVRWRGRVYRVTRVSHGAFLHQRSLSRVYLGANVRLVGSSAFRGCAHLKALKGMGSLRKIGTGAFRGCTRLARVRCLSPRLVCIGARAFYGCKRLERVRFTSKKLAKIGKGAFGHCPHLRRFSLKSNRVPRKALLRAGL